ncbi:hypothetical protein B0H10DRAFT_2427946 [Mycena sp. CBHHK59/15]|nr:hypothetical protein B0H10DRAFT_2427946 [Mycena sp. CBHHK59/15]
MHQNAVFDTDRRFLRAPWRATAFSLRIPKRKLEVSYSMYNYVRPHTPHLYVQDDALLLTSSSVHPPPSVVLERTFCGVIIERQSSALCFHVPSASGQHLVVVPVPFTASALSCHLSPSVSRRQRSLRALTPPSLILASSSQQAQRSPYMAQL